MLKIRLLSRLVAPITAVVSLGLSLPTNAQVVIGAGSTWSSGNATIDWGCDDVTVNGTLDIQAATTTNADSVLINGTGVLNGGSGTLGLTGDFTNSGVFNKNTGTVAISDGCANTSSTIAGSQNFAALSVTTSTGKQLNFTAGSTTTVSPGQLTLAGTAGNLLKIRSTTPGSPAFLNLMGSQNIHHVDVADNTGTGLQLAPGAPSLSNSVNSGNVLNWFDVLLRVPTLSGFSLLLLALGLAAVALQRRRANR
jgi:hypothetical protein